MGVHLLPATGIPDLDLVDGADHHAFALQACKSSQFLGNGDPALLVRQDPCRPRAE